MYDVQTILSAYDKQGTLVQWLKNLDSVLKNSGLEAIEKIEVENGVKLVFKFAGGTSIESPVIEKLQKLDLIADSVQLAYESVNGVTVEYNANITANNEGINGTINILLPIKGSESVVVDVSEDNTTIQIHLDAEVLQNIERALKIPVGTIPATELVAVTSSKEQKMLTVGEGLKIENDTLSINNEFFTIELSQAGASGFLSSNDLNQIINNFPNVNIRRLGKTIYTALEYDGSTNHYTFAHVYTTDTQADTKLILVNGSTGEWTATQYLENLGSYILELAGDNGTLTDEQYTKLTNSFPNVIIKLNGVYVLKPERLIDGKYYFQMVEVDEDESGKFVGDINVIVNANKTWQYGEFYIDVPQGGGGLTWKQVTYNELKTYMNSDNIGKIVMVQPKSSVSSTYLYNLMSPILLPIGYFYDEKNKVTVIGIRYHVSSSLGVNSYYNNQFQLVENIACFTSEGNKGYQVVRAELSYSSTENKYIFASQSTSIFLFEFFDESKMDFYIQE